MRTFLRLLVLTGMVEALLMPVPTARAHYRYDKSYVTLLKIDGKAVRKVASLPLPGHPASMRGSTP